jgi:hypothetical protein
VALVIYIVVSSAWGLIGAIRNRQD